MHASPTARAAYPRASVGAAVAWRRAALFALLALALYVRMREPFASPVIGAEDPYLHMAKAWDLVQGRGLPTSYPPGFAVLLAPFALLGPVPFYLAARFLPPFLGVAEVLGVYLLCREHLRTPAAFTAATLVALMPENVFRTNLLFPTALDLAAIPFYLLLVLRAARGDRRAMAGAVALALALLAIHPWVIVFLVPPTLAIGLLSMRSRRGRVVGLVALGLAAAGAAVFAFLPGAWNPAPSFLQNAGPRALELLRDPRTLFPLPVYVDPLGMLGAPALALAAVGAAAALIRRTTLGVAALVYALAIVPFVFVDWFDVWFIPHRSVAYLSLGLALLAALPVELMGALPEWELADVAGAGVVCAFLVASLAPVAMQVEPWYRLYDEDDYDAWRALDRRDPSLVVTGSWQAAAGYRAMTGEDAVYNPQFFVDPAARADNLARHPDLVVLLDRHSDAAEVKPPGGFREIGRWGESIAYART